MNKKNLNERDICTKFIIPAIVKGGWDVLTHVREEVNFTNPIINALRSRPQAWIDFVMLGLEKPDQKRARTSALMIGVHASPGVLSHCFRTSLCPQRARCSTTRSFFTLCALAVFGYIKGHFTGTSQVRSAFQTVLIGGIAAAVAFGIARFIA